MFAQGDNHGRHADFGELKAWLMANRKASDDFAAMLKLIDESLQDGVIDADETQALYEGIIDCLLTLRERAN